MACKLCPLLLPIRPLPVRTRRGRWRPCCRCRGSLGRWLVGILLRWRGILDCIVLRGSVLKSKWRWTMGIGGRWRRGWRGRRGWGRKGAWWLFAAFVAVFMWCFWLYGGHFLCQFVHFYLTKAADEFDIRNCQNLVNYLTEVSNNFDRQNCRTQLSEFKWLYWLYLTIVSDVNGYLLKKQWNIKQFDY